MQISHYFEFENIITGGIQESVNNQRKMLDIQGIDYTVEPTVSADILHCNLMGPRSMYYAKKAKTHDTPVVIHTHVTAEDFGGSFRFTNGLSKPLKPYLETAYELGDTLICPSEYNRNLLDQYTETDKTVITNGVDADKLDGFEGLREEYLERYSLTPPVVFLVGHVIKRKGLREFVETARRMPELDFAWFGPLDTSLKGRSTKKLIEQSPDNCTFTGFIEDIRGAYAAGDVFFFPTHEENEGIALLEAMRAGKPVVVRDIETFAWLDDGDDCLKSSGDFTEELKRLKDEDVRDTLGNRAVRKSEAFTLPNVADELSSTYRRVIDHGA